MVEWAPEAAEFVIDGTAITPTVFLGGKLRLAQPEKGYRAGFDAVLLAAAVPVIGGGAGMRVLDAGAGVGTVGLAVAKRIADARVTLVERELQLVQMAGWNVRHNGMAERVRVVHADITAPAHVLELSGLEAESQDIVVANPPYQVESTSQRPQDLLKAMSHQMRDGELERWVKFAARVVKPRGALVMIHRTEMLGLLLGCLERRFGDVAVVPVHSRADEPAKRFLIKGCKGSRAPLRVMPGLVVHEGPDNAIRADVKAVSSDGLGLDLF